MILYAFFFKSSQILISGEGLRLLRFTKIGKHSANENQKSDTIPENAPLVSQFQR